MQFLIIAYDYDDAFERRMQSREQHIINTKKMMESGNIVSPDFVAFLIKKIRIPIIKALRLFLSHFWVTHVIIVHVCKKKNKLKWLNKCPNFRKN